METRDSAGFLQKISKSKNLQDVIASYDQRIKHLEALQEDAKRDLINSAKSLYETVR